MDFLGTSQLTTKGAGGIKSLFGGPIYATGALEAGTVVNFYNTAATAIGSVQHDGISVYNTLSITVPTVIYSYDYIPPDFAKLGPRGAIRVTLFGDMKGASGTPTWTFAINFGGVTLWKATTPGTGGGSATRFPWWMEFILGNTGTTNSQVLGGWLNIGPLGTATVGEGNLSVAAPRVYHPFFGTSAVDTTVEQLLTITAMPSISNVGDEITVQYALTEILP